MVTKLNRSDVSNLSPYDTQDSNSHEEHHSSINKALESGSETNLTQIIFENKIAEEDALIDTLTNWKMFEELKLFLNNT